MVGLPLAWRITILAMVVVEFLIGHGAVWRRLEWDRSILWSYATIPILVATALALRRRLRLLPFCLHTLEIACYKFAITASVLIGVLIVRGEKIEPPRSRPLEAPAAPSHRARPRVHVAPDPEAGEIAGTVRDESGQALGGVLVYLAPGDVTGETPETALIVENDGRRLLPEVAAVMLGQPLYARSRDGLLHTLRVRGPGGRNLLHVPMLASGQAAPVRLEEGTGLLELGCAVHGSRERPAHLVLLDHPFFTVTSETGAFQVSGVGSGVRTVHALAADGRVAKASGPLGKRGKLILELRLSR